MTTIAIDKVLPNPEQPRINFDPQELQGLATSIQEMGVIHPIVVEEAGEFYILHDGERRLRAAKMAGLTEIPATITPALNGTGALERLTRALVANMQRSDLGPVEEALGLQKMVEYGLSVPQISRKVGHSSGYVYDRLRLLELEPEIQEKVNARKLPCEPRPIKALLSINDPAIRVRLAEKAAERRSSTKAILEAVKRMQANGEASEQRKRRAPAISHALAKSKYRFKPAQWDALHQIGQVPPWPVVVNAAEATCRACILRSSASEAVCKECPAPEMLRRTIEEAMKGG